MELSRIFRIFVVNKHFKYMTKFQEQVLDLLGKGFTVSKIAKSLDCNVTSVSSVRKRFGITNYNKEYVNTVNHEFFDSIDSEHKAYYLGFIIADGSISYGKDHNDVGRFSINIQNDDINILNSLKEDLNIPNKIYVKNNQKGVIHRKLQASLRWTSKHMLDIFTNEYNILPNKTMNFDFIFPLEKIPNEYKGAFVRGFIDGDGSFESHGYVFNPTIVGTSIEWLKQIGDLVSEKTGLTYVTYKNIGKTCNYYTLRWSANRINKFDKISKLYNFLYKDATIYLDRKLKKIVSYLEYRAKQLGVTSPVSVTHRD